MRRRHPARALTVEDVGHPAEVVLARVTAPNRRTPQHNQDRVLRVLPRAATRTWGAVVHGQDAAAVSDRVPADPPQLGHEHVRWHAADVVAAWLDLPVPIALDQNHLTCCRS